MRKHKISKIDRRFWLINSNRSRVKWFSKNNQYKDKVLEYLFIDSGRILDALEKEPPLIKTREELKVNRSRDEWKKLSLKVGGEPNQFGKTLSNQYCC